MEISKAPLGSYAPDFELPGVDGSVHHLRRYLEKYRAVVVVFMCNHCPYVQAYLERMNAIQTEYQPQVTLVGINSNDDQQFPEDSFDKMKTFVEARGLNFPYLRDPTQEVAREFGAERTPEIFLVDQQGIICYNGRIDDNDRDPSQVKSHDLRQALDELLNNGQVSLASTPALGCSIKWRR